MKKNTLRFFVIFVISFGFWTCNQKNEKEVIKIGAILPLTGPGSQAGIYIKNGLELGVSKYNKLGLKKYKLIIQDNKTNAKDGINAYKNLSLNNDINYLITTVSSVGKALTQYIDNDKVINFGVAMAYPDFAKDSEYNFRVYPNAKDLTGAVVDEIAKENKLQKLAIFYINDEFGLTSNVVFRTSLERINRRVVFSESYSIVQNDFKDIVTKLIQANSNAVYICGYGPAYMNILRELKVRNYKGHIYGDMTLGIESNKNIARKIFPEGLIYVDAKMSNTFKEEYKICYNEKPSSYAGYAYDIINIINAIETKITFNNIKSPNIIIDSLEVNGVMGNINFNNIGEANLKFIKQNTNND